MAAAAANQAMDLAHQGLDWAFHRVVLQAATILPPWLLRHVPANWQALTPAKLAVVTPAAFIVARIVMHQLHQLRIKFALRNVQRAPQWLPIVGHTWALLIGTPWDVFHSWFETTGADLLKANVMGENSLLVYKPRHLRQIMNSKLHNYPKDVDFAFKTFMDILGSGLVSSNGALWKKQRTLLSHALRIDILEETMPVAKRAIDRLSEKLEAIRGTGEYIEIAEEFRVLTLQVIGELILSLSPEESSRVFPDLYLPIMEEANRRVWEPYRAYIPTPGWFHYNRTLHELNNYLCNLIRKRWADRQAAVAAGTNEDDKDILEVIMADIDPATWGEGTVLQLRDEIKTFIMAGHETSAAMMTWACYELHRHPEVREKFIQEAQAVFGTGIAADAEGADKFTKTPLPANEQLKGLQYTMNVLKETLRFYSLVPVVARVTVEDDVLDGHVVPAGTRILISLRSAHDNPETWKDPMTYRPERFDEPFDLYAFMPFIQGPRNCLGQHLALLEARIVMALLMLRFKLTPRDESCGERHPSIVPVCPKNGMWVRVD
ncbi:uncharacterized protein MONBRDRAFT_33214 [Monosiga brevicollis MX1]|uniref:Cytochrome P450 n=1 Tax=Monosiga brevicollis TaxID=81824 RepID=A9V470_MONBE|nr:uncharacterized protein MONBRDRAFT_33214 [Monosiga brevicollis MX1]EDQ87567.1 predicted protein [Monosiga brevicollis MX1]|eukprot:XP_001747487.1 hypothetical protein [Monosiga brevicollis MX1]